MHLMQTTALLPLSRPHVQHILSLQLLPGPGPSDSIVFIHFLLSVQVDQNDNVVDPRL